MTHGLELGTIDLVSGALAPEGYKIAVYADGVTFGSPEAVVREIVSMLADGNHARYDRAGNRVVSFDVEIEADDGVKLQAGEVALRRELYRPNAVKWTPPATLSAPTVFEIVTSSMSAQFDDIDELAGRRVFNVTLTCSPFARSVDLTTVTALAPPPASLVTASITNADTTTGFSAVADTGAITVTDQGTYAQAKTSAGLGDYASLRMMFTPASAIDTTTTPYVVIEASGDYPDSFRINGAVRGLVLSRATTSGTTIYVLKTGGLSVTSIAIYRTRTDNAAAITLNVHDIYRTNTVPQVTSRQSAAVAEIGGTERTPCSLQVNPAAGESMGVALVHTSPESGLGYSPALRQRRVSGNTVTTSSTLVSGGREPVTTTPIVAHIPLTSLPEDGYALVSLMRSTVAGTFPVVWQARTFFSGNFLGGYTGTAQATFTDPNLWTLIPLAVVTLPPVRASQNAFVQLNINRSPVAAEVIDLDEWWTFRTGDDCALTIVQSTSSFLWLDSPDVSNPVPRVWVGIQGDRSDARHPGAGLLAQGNHVLHPDGTSIFVATTGIADPTVTASAHKRWHSNAAE